MNKEIAKNSEKSSDKENKFFKQFVIFIMLNIVRILKKPRKKILDTKTLNLNKIYCEKTHKKHFVKVILKYRINKNNWSDCFLVLYT
jgi:hypothetical protein